VGRNFVKVWIQSHTEKGGFLLDLGKKFGSSHGREESA